MPRTRPSRGDPLSVGLCAFVFNEAERDKPRTSTGEKGVGGTDT